MARTEAEVVRARRNAIHLEAIAQALQGLVRLTAFQLELQSKALELDMGEDWRNAVIGAVVHGTNIDLPLDGEGLTYQESKAANAGVAPPPEYRRWIVGGGPV